ncbi:DegV family protein [Paenibacillus eucommiae]|uniref:DegV family protein with EDD domain n=1 Tax=Paenibacillus eucommiae TaxID=1355755 RepID=A0ABS4IXZ8_9BACL|nr:DegV family protein [Paenibacillus eucommiae]MBP1991424.1 DegV family protein with EDD domain [Paenibacillus eucommiae]
MSSIRIVTDSTADIPLAVREELGIEMVPLKIHFGSETFLDAVTLQSASFYEKLVSTAALPTTSQPSPLEFMEVYKRLAEEPGTQIISIHLSSALSGTYQSAVLAGNMMEEEKLGKVNVVDSLSASYGIGVLAVAAAKAAREGHSVEQILTLIQNIRKDYKIYFLVDTLSYLQKGGRIGKASAVLGSLLSIKPILSIDKDGVVAAIDKVRGQRKAMARIIELMQADIPGKALHLVIAHANNLEAADQLRGLIEDNFEVLSVEYIILGPVIGAHAGPGTSAAFIKPV